MKTLWPAVIGVILACTLDSAGAEYAGWTVGHLWGDGHVTILHSTDSGGSWSRQGVGQVADVDMWGVVAVNPLTAWVVGSPDSGYATIYHTTDGGLTWTRKGSAAQVPNTPLQKVAAFGDNNIWAVGLGTILHSSDGGATWTNQIPAGYESAHLQGVCTPDGLNVWATGEALSGYATILKSGDGGQSWTRQSGGDVNHTNHLLGISAVDANTAWTVGGNLTGGYDVLGTINSGLTWTEQYSVGLGDANEVCAVSASTVWVACDSLILRSTDGGQSWVNCGSPPTYTMGISAVDSQQAWTVSTVEPPVPPGAIWHTTDGGNSWAKLTQLGSQTLPGLWTVSFSRQAVPAPTPTPTNTPVPGPATPTPVPTDTPIPTATPLPTATVTPTATAVPTATPRPGIYSIFPFNILCGGLGGGGALLLGLSFTLLSIRQISRRSSR